MVADSSTIRAFCSAAGRQLSHRFEVITALDDGTVIPVEALSEDHSIGIYGRVVPRKMLEQVAGYEQVDLSDFRPQSVLAQSSGGSTHESYLEYVPLRGVRFRAEQLQYLEEGWWATLAEVKYPTHTVLTVSHLVKQAYGAVYLYLNRELPMPLWIRPAPMGAGPAAVQIAIQVRAGNRMRPTNIHTECPMEYARRWVEWVRDYYDAVPLGE